MQNLKASFHFIVLTGCLLLTWCTFTFEAQAQPSPSPTPKIPEDKKIIHVFARQGPYGELYVPKELVAVSDQFKLAKDVNEKYFFPSIYFIVSAMPQIEKERQKVVQNVQHWKFYEPKSTIEWIDLVIKIKAVDCKNQLIEDPEQLRSKVRILGLLPDETLARVEEQKPAELAGALGDLTHAFAPFVPGQSEFLNAGANTASVLFRNVLYPPKLETYRYSFIKNAGTLGWYWKTDQKSLTSLVGTRRGIVLLQVQRGSEGIKKLHLSYELLAQWQGKGEPSTAVDDEYVDYDEIGEDIDFSGINKCTEEHNKDIFETAEYRTLQHLEEFPMLIPQDAVCKIFQVAQRDCDARIEELKKEYKLTIFEGTRPSSKGAGGAQEVIKRPSSNGPEGTQEIIKLLRRSDLEDILGVKRSEKSKRGKAKPESQQ